MIDQLMGEQQKFGALDGIIVVDLSRILAGPWASQMLADFGAQVIKVERPNKGDDTRYWGPPFIKRAESTISSASTTASEIPEAAYFHCANRNKQSIAIDITSKDGQNIIKDLVIKADVLIENYKVGGLAKYGLDYESLKSINPKIVYCSITGYGQTGPSANKPGYDAMIQGEGGLMSLTGVSDGEPMKVGVALTDITTGLYACNAILAALLARHKNGVGQYIDIALLDTQVAMLANQGMNYLATQENPVRLGNQHPNIVPYQTFATADGSLILAIGNDQQFARFCALCKLHDVATDQRFMSNQHRVVNRSILIPIIAQVIASRTTEWWVSQLETINVPCGPVNQLDQVFSHPQIKHRKMVRQLKNEDGQVVSSIASPINLSETPIKYHSSSPRLGQHSRKILTELLDYDESSIEQLFENGSVG